MQISRDPALAKSARTGLSRCMRALKEMSGIWGSAARQYALLDGLVDLAEAEREGEGVTMTDVESVLRGRKRGHITEPPTGVQTPTEGAVPGAMSDLAFKSQLDALAALLPARHEPLPRGQAEPPTLAPEAAPVFGEQPLHFDDFLGSLLGCVRRCSSSADSVAPSRSTTAAAASTRRAPDRPTRPAAPSCRRCPCRRRSGRRHHQVRRAATPSSACRRRPASRSSTGISSSLRRSPSPGRSQRTEARRGSCRCRCRCSRRPALRTLGAI